MNEQQRSPEELLAGAKLGFEAAYEFAPKDADHLRLGAADMFEQGVGELLYRKLAALGMSDDRIEGLTETDLFALAPDEMALVRQHVQALDPKAQKVLSDVVYDTESRNGITRND